MKFVTKYLILLIALIMACSVAYVSITGLMHLFLGGTVLLIFFTVIEVGKIISTTAVHTFSDKLNFKHKILLNIFIVLSMIITSSGIYGYLSNSYSNTVDRMNIGNEQVQVIQEKIPLLLSDKTNLESQIQSKQERVKSLIDLRTQQEIRLDSLYARRQFSSARRTEKIIAEANTNLNKSEEDISILTNKINVINDSISSFKTTIISMNSNNEAKKELNSLIYISNALEVDMSVLMKWFILVLALLGDPFAVTMVIVFNRIMLDSNKQTPLPEIVEPTEKIDFTQQIENKDKILEKAKLQDEIVEADKLIKEAFEKEEQENPEEIPQPESIEIPNLPVSESVVIEKEPMETLVTQSITPEIVNEPIIPKANLGKFIKQSDTVKLSPEEIKEYFDLTQQKPKPRASYTDKRSF